MMLQFFAYAIAVAALLSVVGICLERVSRLHRLPGRTAWAAAMLLSVLLPVAMVLLARPAEIRDVPVPAAAHDVAIINPESADSGQSPVAQSPADPFATAFPRSTWKLPRPSDRLLLAMWMATSSMLALYLLGANLLLRRRMRGWRNATVQDQQVLISEMTGPALLGAFSPRIVVPRWLLAQPHRTQALILQHEQQHVLARDALMITIGLLAIVAAPWNLPLWWQWRRMRQAIELDCDARVLDAGADANAYAEVLLAITQRSTRIPSGALAMSEPVHALERRIANLLPDAIRHARLQTMAVLLLAAAGAGAVLALEAPALPGRTTAATMAVPQGISTPVSAVMSASPPTVVTAAQSPVIATAAAPAPRAEELAPAIQTQAGQTSIGDCAAARAWCADLRARDAQMAAGPASLTEGGYIMAAVTRGDIEDLVTSTGTLTPRDYVDVEAQVSGRIEKLHVQVGDVVQKSDVLAEIGGWPGCDHCTADIARIMAPIAGTVLKIQVRQGQTVNAAQDVPVVMQIANLSTMTVVSEVSEVDVPRLHKGIKAYFMLGGANSRRWYGELRRIEPAPKMRNGMVSYSALIDVQNDDRSLRPQMTAQVYFVSAEARNVLLVPLAALAAPEAAYAAARGMQRRNGTVMVKKADGTLEARQVVVGVTDRVRGEVLEGLNEGEEVVIGKSQAEAAAAPSRK